MIITEQLNTKMHHNHFITKIKYKSFC